MSLFKTPYDTTVGSGLHTKDVAARLREVLIHTPEVVSYDVQVEPYLGSITGAYETHATVPVFAHPFEVVGVDKKKHLFIDYRPFVKLDTTDKWTPKVIVRNIVEYNFAKARLLMTKLWLTQSPNNISGLSSLPMGTFASWLSESITHKFALDMGDQVRLAVIAGMYYQSLFHAEEDIDEQMRSQFVANCVRVLRISAEIVFSTVENLGSLTNIKSFCDAVKSTLDNTRLEEFNEGILVLILRGTWFGTNSGEILAVALEHPPTWVSLVYTSLSERTFKNSTIAKISERYGKGGASEMFMRSFVALAKSVEPVQE